MKICRLSSRAKFPQRATEGAAGYDLFAAERTVIPGARASEGRVDIGRALVPTGLALSIPAGHVGRIGSRSGLSVKSNIETGAGWIDADYRGEVKVELKNFSGQDFIVEEGDRIAQLIILPIVTPDLEPIDRLPSTERGGGGFGSTGTQ
ncbi:MAG TPA: dUTP diphosphatase [Nitrospirales bacterium]